jgi:hypothetical protein
MNVVVACTLHADPTEAFDKLSAIKEFASLKPYTESVELFSESLELASKVMEKREDSEDAQAAWGKVFECSLQVEGQEEGSAENNLIKIMPTGLPSLLLKSLVIPV